MSFLIRSSLCLSLCLSVCYISRYTLPFHLFSFSSLSVLLNFERSEDLQSSVACTLSLSFSLFLDFFFLPRVREREVHIRGRGRFSLNFIHVRPVRVQEPCTVSPADLSIPSLSFFLSLPPLKEIETASSLLSNSPFRPPPFFFSRYICLSLPQLLPLYVIHSPFCFCFSLQGTEEGDDENRSSQIVLARLQCHNCLQLLEFDSRAQFVQCSSCLTLNAVPRPPQQQQGQLRNFLQTNLQEGREGETSSNDDLLTTTAAPSPPTGLTGGRVRRRSLESYSNSSSWRRRRPANQPLPDLRLV